MRTNSLRALLTFDAEYFDRNNKAAVANSLAHDTEQTYKLVGPTMGLILMVIAAYSAGIFLSCYYNWWVGITSAIVAPFFAYAAVRKNAHTFNGFGGVNY